MTETLLTVTLNLNGRSSLTYEKDHQYFLNRFVCVVDTNKQILGTTFALPRLPFAVYFTNKFIFDLFLVGKGRQ